MWTDPRGVWIERHEYSDGVRFIVFERIGYEVDVLDWAPNLREAVRRVEASLRPLFAA